jgi:hypothetical protein
VGLVDEAPITGSMAGRSGRCDEVGREGLHLPVHRHVSHLDAALGQQFSTSR